MGSCVVALHRNSAAASVLVGEGLPELAGWRAPLRRGGVGNCGEGSYSTMVVRPPMGVGRPSMALWIQYAQNS